MRETRVRQVGHRRTRLALRAVIPAALAALLLTLGALPPLRPAPVAAAAAPLKVVVIVGPVEGLTPTYISWGERVAQTAERNGADVRRIYSPNATWQAVLDNIQGASVVVYLGHGNGFPSPYGTTLNPYAQDGFGLNRSAGAGDSNVTYFGEYYIARDVHLAPNAVVFLNHACYSAGSSEPGYPDPSLDVARQRVDNFAAGFILAGARAVFALAYGDPSPYLDEILTTDRNVKQIYETGHSWTGTYVQRFSSTRSPGFDVVMDPDAPSSFHSALTVDPALTAGQVRAAATPAPSAASTPATYVPVTPVRLLDTRFSTGLVGAFTHGVSRTFQVAGRGGVPSTASAITGNLTVVGQTSAGWVYLGPNPTTNPVISTLNFPYGDTRAIGVTMPLGTSGTLSAVFFGATVRSTTHLLLDVTGYFVPDATGATYVPLTTARLLDTRFGNGLAGPFLDSIPRTFQVTGRGGVPGSATAVTGNLTVVGQTMPGFVYLGPNPTSAPTSSTINFPLGDTRANGVAVPLGTGGTLSAVYVSGWGQTQLVFDVTGYFVPDGSGASYVPLAPTRVLDSRFGNGLSGPFVDGVPRTFQVAGREGVPADARGVTGSLTVTQQTRPGFFYLGPDPTSTPNSSTINFPLYDNRINGVTVALGSGGTLSPVYIGGWGQSQLVFDVTGYFR